MTRRIVVTAGAVTVSLAVVAVGAAVVFASIALRNSPCDPEDTPDTVREAWMRNRRAAQ